LTVIGIEDGDAASAKFMQAFSGHIFGVGILF